MWHEVKQKTERAGAPVLEFSEDGKLAIGIPYYRVSHSSGVLLEVRFQNGTIPEHGINGVTIENLLEICRHRLAKFQESKFSCDENARAITGIDFAIAALHERTSKRKARGVEGVLLP